MARVVLEKVTKTFGSVVAVQEFSLEIADEEFVVIVGPSGCGKSTVLRMIAGLEEVTSGEIWIDGKPMVGVPPKDRDIAMVFQNYALYPHMSVAQNMSFGLRLRKVPRLEIEPLVAEAAEILQIGHLLDRRPRELSGGQRQRVALGRAIVRKPKVFLMDEPLSNLDAKLRVEMRASLAHLHRRLGVTTVYVTHDQIEAMTMGSRIVVMRDGVVEQVAAPLTLYNQPNSRFVAEFIGSPAMNLLEGRVRSGQIEGGSFAVRPDDELVRRLAAYEGADVWLGVRPEDLDLPGFTDVPEEGHAIRAEVRLVEPIGSETILICGVGESTVVARVDPEVDARVGDVVTLIAKPHKVHAFSMADEHSIRFEDGAALARAMPAASATRHGPAPETAMPIDT